MMTINHADADDDDDDDEDNDDEEDDDDGDNDPLIITPTLVQDFNLLHTSLSCQLALLYFQHYLDDELFQIFMMMMMMTMMIITLMMMMMMTKTS